MVTMAKTKPKLNPEALHSRLKIRSLVSEATLIKNNPAAADFFTRFGLRPGKIRDHAGRIFTSGVLAGSLLFSSQLPLKVEATHPKTYISSEAFNLNPDQKLISALADNLQTQDDWQITTEQEQRISAAIFDAYGLQVRATLDGQKLNHSVGRMGAEQHLPRFPGDSAEQHSALVEKGITPGRGAWGYFADSKDNLTQELIDTEKWYVAVQTLYLPDWNTNTKELAQWYKYRRVVVVNPANGKLVVAAIADAGPARFTGKHFGGSPEVMQYLGINYGKQNHPVILFFLDDPEKKVSLGPVEYNVAKKSEYLADSNEN